MKGLRSNTGGKLKLSGYTVNEIYILLVRAAYKMPEGIIELDSHNGTYSVQSGTLNTLIEL